MSIPLSSTGNVFDHRGGKLENRQFLAKMHQIAPNCVSNFKIFPRVIPPDPHPWGGDTSPQTPPYSARKRLDSWPSATRWSPWKKRLDKALMTCIQRHTIILLDDFVDRCWLSLWFTSAVCLVWVVATVVVVVTDITTQNTLPIVAGKFIRPTRSPQTYNARQTTTVMQLLLNVRPSNRLSVTRQDKSRRV